MVALLQGWGYTNVEYGVVSANEVDGPTDEDWDAAIDEIGFGGSYYFQRGLHDDNSGEKE